METSGVSGATGVGLGGITETGGLVVGSILGGGCECVLRAGRCLGRARADLAACGISPPVNAIVGGRLGEWRGTGVVDSDTLRAGHFIGVGVFGFVDLFTGGASEVAVVCGGGVGRGLSFE